MKPNHIFVFLEVFTQEGGIQSYVKDVLTAYTSLHKYQAEVLLLRDEAGCHNPFNAVKTIKFHYLKSTPAALGRVKLAAQLLQCLLLRPPERVFCGHIKLAPLVELFCTPLGIPFTLLTYGKEVWQPLPQLERQALKKAQKIWTISRYSGSQLTKTHKVNPIKIELLPCIVDGDTFTPGPKPLHLVSKYNLDGCRVLMTVARLWSGDIYKGVDVTIRALPEILTSFPDVKYLIIGRGDDQPRLAQLAKHLGVLEKVIFAGFVLKEDLPQHYRLADAYIMPSQEGFGIVYLEALATGKPVLSGQEDGAADPLQDGLVGWRVPHRDSEAVASACIEILKGQDQRCDGTWLREQTLAKFSPQALKSRLEELLE